MADYTYSKEYKDLSAQKELLEGQLTSFLNSVPGGEEMVKKFESLKDIMDKKIDLANDEISDLEWNHENDLDDKDDEIKELENRVEVLERKMDELGVTDSGYLEDVMKMELWAVASKKFTLTQLEEKLGGSRYQLM
jgi:chromosome segregation ATPase